MSSGPANRGSLVSEPDTVLGIGFEVSSSTTRAPKNRSSCGPNVHAVVRVRSVAAERQIEAGRRHVGEREAVGGRERIREVAEARARGLEPAAEERDRRAVDPLRRVAAVHRDRRVILRRAVAAGHPERRGADRGVRSRAVDQRAVAAEVIRRVGDAHADRHAGAGVCAPAATRGGRRVRADGVPRRARHPGRQTPVRVDPVAGRRVGADDVRVAAGGVRRSRRDREQQRDRDRRSTTRPCAPICRSLGRAPGTRSTQVTWRTANAFRRAP